MRFFFLRQHSNKNLFFYESVDLFDFLHFSFFLSSPKVPFRLLYSDGLLVIPFTNKVLLDYRYIEIQKKKKKKKKIHDLRIKRNK